MTKTLSDHADFIAPYVTWARPEGAGPFPCVVQLHGCGGRKPLMDTWAEVFTRAGCAALIVDSYGPRRISRMAAYASVCTGLRLQGRERAGDLFAAFALARAQSFIDPTRIFAAGWSHGGWTLLDALGLRLGGEAARATGLSPLEDEPLAGFAGALLFYPYCGVASLASRRPWRVTAPSLAILGGRDDIVGRTQPRAAIEALKARGAPIALHVFETATHAFDEPDARHPQVRYDAALTRRAQELAGAFLRALPPRAGEVPSASEGMGA